MVTLDVSAFGAVSEFFNNEKKNTNEDENTKGKLTTNQSPKVNVAISSNINASSGRKSRLGVGAKDYSDGKDKEKEGTAAASLRKAIVTNKKKRRRNRQDWDEDSDLDDDNGVSNLDVNDDDASNEDEEDEGRTSIARSTPKVKGSKHYVAAAANVDHSSMIASSSAKKKKKGKKERQREATNAVEDNNLSTQNNSSDDVEMVHDESMQRISIVEGQFQTVSNRAVSGTTVGEVNKNEKKKSKTVKRKKIRSKQKNIRKDTRRAIDKPSHLILGRSDYAGRPITPETRSKLNMPKRVRPDPSLTKSKSYQSSTNNVNEADIISGLAVDDLDLIKNNPDETDIDNKIKPTKKKKSKKAKKSKYKNLQ